MRMRGPLAMRMLRKSTATLVIESGAMTHPQSSRPTSHPLLMKANG